MPQYWPLCLNTGLNSQYFPEILSIFPEILRNVRYFPEILSIFQKFSVFPILVMWETSDCPVLVEGLREVMSKTGNSGPGGGKQCPSGGKQCPGVKNSHFVKNCA